MPTTSGTIETNALGFFDEVVESPEQQKAAQIQAQLLRLISMNPDTPQPCSLLELIKPEVDTTSFFKGFAVPIIFLRLMGYFSRSHNLPPLHY